MIESPRRASLTFAALALCLAANGDDAPVMRTVREALGDAPQQ